MFNENEVNQINNKYKFNVRCFSNKIHLESRTDTWIITMFNEQCYFLNHVHNRTKHKTHRQHKFTRLEHVFDSINTHDKFVSNGRVCKIS